MIVWILFILSALTAAVLSVSFGYISNWFDIWKTALSFVCAFLAYNLLYVLYLYVIGLFIDQAKPIAKQLNIYRRNCWNVGVLGCFYAGVKVHVSGREKLPEDERFLMVCNHRSMFDPLAVLSSLRRYNISFVSKESNMKIPALGNVSYGAGFLGLNREDNRKALKSILTAAEYIKSGICSMLIYPEGTRSHSEEMGDFHAGSFKIAQKASCPLVISCIRGSEKVGKNVLRRKSDVYIDILEVIPADRVKQMSTTELADHAKQLMKVKMVQSGETVYA